MKSRANTTTAFAFALATLTAATVLVPITPVQARDVMVGGAPMLPSKTIVENASQAKSLTTLVAAVKAADLVDTLSSKGPFTVFAPTNGAFDRLPKGTVATLLKPENKKKLAKILTAHVVSGNVSAADLVALIKKGKGHAVLTTVSGDKIIARRAGSNITLTDESRGKATVRIADVNQSNGVVHVIDAVLLPK